MLLVLIFFYYLSSFRIFHRTFVCITPPFPDYILFPVFVFVFALLQVFRGHVGRKVAKRWALKRAELGAMNALLNATAICLQRYWRGYMGRQFTIYKRTEMAHFIALMRVQESAVDEELYWQTHPWTRFKKNRKEWMRVRTSAFNIIIFLLNSSSPFAFVNAIFLYLHTLLH